MLHLKPRSGVLFLVATLLATAYAFTPSQLTTPEVQAGCGQTVSGWVNVGSWETCNWDFGCWINPHEPNNIKKHFTRWCRNKYDERNVFCGTDCYEQVGTPGCC